MGTVHTLVPRRHPNADTHGFRGFDADLFVPDFSNNTVYFTPEGEAHYAAWFSRYGLNFEKARKTPDEFNKQLALLCSLHREANPDLKAADEKALAAADPATRALVEAVRKGDWAAALSATRKDGTPD